ncbi:hypothetical protein SALINJAH_119 [Bacillus phage SalinJah]|uniref:Lipoprotein n=1 Tax=Bacillus phage SalinJah TaxID=1837830 RepID=A0A173GBH4_9CAUD|nr:hypothetical protein SALINJAH_119 [Bacillus phage SalinJah]ANH50555.1 hypothetical protein SALINJAH_119 [Bacillus phage SalinJah]
MKKKLAAFALTSTLLVGVVTGCAASKSEDKKEETKKEKSLPERRGVQIWAMKGKSEEYYEGKDIKEYYRSNKSGVLVITFKNGHEVQVTNYHLEEAHPNEN